GICRFHNESYGTALVPAHFHSYNYWEVWGGTREDATAKVRQWYQLPSFENLDPVPGALAALQTLQLHYHLVVVTSRQDFVAPQTIRNIQRHYPGIFADADIHFANHWIDPSDHKHYHGRGIISKSKAQLCQEANALLLVDDNLDYARDVSKHGLMAVLFDAEGSYLWNKCADNALPERTVRCTSWKEIVALLCPAAEDKAGVPVSSLQHV
ncbi:hypothetical protein SeMB42_g05536, partial [Synchytrium endobioticum]